jgi:hypothetical protein
VKRMVVAASVVSAALLTAPAEGLADSPFTYSGCEGQTVSNFVQGIGARDAAANFGLSVPQAHNIVTTTFCGADVGIIPNPRPSTP